MARKRLTILPAVRAVELFFNLIFWGIFVLALLSPHISPRTLSWPSLFNLAYPLLLFFAVCLLLFYLIRRIWWIAGVYILLLLVSLNYTLTYFPLNSPDKKAKKDLRVMSYNVVGFSRSQDNNLLAADLILRYDPDIVCLQEASLSGNRRENQRRFERYFGKKWKYINTSCGQDIPSRGLVLLSKYPIRSCEMIRYPSEGNGSRLYIIDFPGKKRLLLVNNHLESYKLTPEEKTHYKYRIKNSSLKSYPRILNDVRQRIGPQLRIRALASERVASRVAAVRQELHPDYVIVCGDLNDTPMSYAYSQLRGDLDDGFADKGRGRGISFNERFFPFRIDHLFYGRGLKAVRARIPRHKECSDHNPLIVDFKIQKR